jgi:hypothetical protein
MKRYALVNDVLWLEEDGEWCAWPDVDALLAQCEEALGSIYKTVVRGHSPEDVTEQVGRIRDSALAAIRTAREGI